MKRSMDRNLVVPPPGEEKRQQKDNKNPAENKLKKKRRRKTLQEKKKWKFKKKTTSRRVRWEIESGWPACGTLLIPDVHFDFFHFRSLDDWPNQRFHALFRCASISCFRVVSNWVTEQYFFQTFGKWYNYSQNSHTRLWVWCCWGWHGLLFSGRPDQEPFYGRCWRCLE